MRFREEQRFIVMIILLLINTKNNARIVFSTNITVKHLENMAFYPSHLMCYNFKSLYMDYLFLQHSLSLDSLASSHHFLLSECIMPSMSIYRSSDSLYTFDYALNSF
jgi:hypothetical protein